MEEYYEFIGSDSGDSGADEDMKMYIYSAPQCSPINICGELKRGSYFASTGLLMSDDSKFWMKIRRGKFSAATLIEYIQITVDYSSRKRKILSNILNEKLPHPTYKYLSRIPQLPAFFCGRESLFISRLPVFRPTTTNHLNLNSNLSHREIPRLNVFRALELQLNEDFTQLGLKITTMGGLNGWIVLTSYSSTLIPVDDPLGDPPRYLIQNISSSNGKWDGNLPLRNKPNLKETPVGLLKRYQLAIAKERKLIDDRIWIRIALSSKKSMNVENEDENEDGSDNLWVVERNANTCQQVVIPWGRPLSEKHDFIDIQERHYRNLSPKSHVPLYQHMTKTSEVIGKIKHGAVFVSNWRSLDKYGRLWVRIQLNSENRIETSDHQFAYALQNQMKTNRCILEPIPTPRSFRFVQYYQITLPPLKHRRIRINGDASVPDNTLSVYTEGSLDALVLGEIPDGTVLSVMGSIYNPLHQDIWYQVPYTTIRQRIIGANTELQQDFVYVPACDPLLLESLPPYTVVEPIYAKVTPLNTTTSLDSVCSDTSSDKTSDQIIFRGRASQLFSESSLLQSSDPPINLGNPINLQESQAQARAKQLKEEIESWQSQRIPSKFSIFTSCIEKASQGITNCFQNHRLDQYRQVDTKLIDEMDLEEYPAPGY